MRLSSIVLKMNQTKTYSFHNHWRWNFFKQVLFNCHNLPRTLLDFYLGVTFVLLVLAQWFLKLKKILSTILPHTFFFTKFSFWPRINQNIYLFVREFCFLDTVFGYKPRLVWELRFLTPFSGITTLWSLVPKKQCKGP